MAQEPLQVVDAARVADEEEQRAIEQLAADDRERADVERDEAEFEQAAPTQKASIRLVPSTPTRLITKLTDAMGHIGRVPKAGFNQHFGYEFVRESDLVEAIRNLLAERNVLLYEEIDEFTETPRGDRGNLLCQITGRAIFVDGESGETLELPFRGFAMDTQDKGYYKAWTGGLKYILMKTFLVATGDDPEQDGGESGQARSGSRAGRSGGAGGKRQGTARSQKEPSKPSGKPSAPPDFDTPERKAAWERYEKGLGRVCTVEKLSARDALKKYAYKVCEENHWPFPPRYDQKGHTPESLGALADVWDQLVAPDAE